MESNLSRSAAGSSERNYGIDALRLVLMYMVCVLHTLGQGGILSASAAGTLEYKVYWFMEVLSFCAVDGFALISGYTAKNKARSCSRIIDMWLQVFFYSFVLTLLLSCLSGTIDLPVKELIKAALPVTFEKYWYFTAYFALFFAIPVLNSFLFSLEAASARKALILMVALYSVTGVVADPFKMHSGYSALWLIVLYGIGCLAKRGELFEKRRSGTLIAWWALSLFLSWFFHVYLGTRRLFTYVSPTILLSGLIMVILSSRLKLKGAMIAKLSPLAFGIYLFQLNQIIWNKYLKNAFTFVLTKNIFLGVVYVLLIALAIWAAGLIVEWIRTMLFSLLHVSAFSKRASALADKGLSKLSAFLK